MPKKVFITGITGFAGSHLTAEIFESNTYTVTGTYIGERGLDTLPFREKVDLVRLDLNDAASVEDVLKEKKPDFLIHLAALTSPSESFKRPTETITANVQMQINILEALWKNNLKDTKVLVVSSADTYGIVKPEDLPIDENTPFNPTNPYAVSKIVQDYIGLQYFISYKLPIIRVRPFNHIGPGQLPHFVISSFAKQIAEIEKGKKEPVLMVGNLETKRDFTDVRDVVSAYILALEKGMPGDVYNIGSGISHKISDVLDLLLSFAKIHIAVKVDESRLRPSDTPELLCDPSKFKKASGWEPKISLEQTLKDTLDYWRKIV